MEKKDGKQCIHCHELNCELDLSFRDKYKCSWCNKCVRQFETFITKLVKNIHDEAKNKDIKCDLTTIDMKKIFFKYKGFTFEPYTPPFSLSGQCSQCYQCYQLGPRSFLEVLSRDENFFDWCNTCVYDFNRHIPTMYKDKDLTIENKKELFLKEYGGWKKYCHKDDWRYY